MRRPHLLYCPVGNCFRNVNKIWPFLLFTFIVNTLGAQSNSSSSDFYQEFDREMDHQTIQTIDNHRHKTVRSQLPGWWGEIPDETADTIYTIGISDPGLPDSTAFRQALIRACGLASLAKNCTATHLSDLYFKSRSCDAESKYEEMCRLSSVTPWIPKQLRVLRSAKIKSREILVLAALPKKLTGRDSGTVSLEGYQYEYTTDICGKDALIRKYNLIIHPSMDTVPVFANDTVTFYQYNLQFKGVKNLEQKLNKNKKQVDYYYTSAKKTTRDNNFFAYTDCTSGLWIALMNRIFLQAGFYVKKKSNQTQVVRDRYTTTGNEIEREKMEYGLKINIRQIVVNNNGLRIYTNLSNDE